MNTLTTEQKLQRTANIDKIKHAWRIVKIRERRELISEREEDAQELNFEDIH